MNNKIITYGLIGGGVLIAALASWFFFFPSTPKTGNVDLGSGFGVGNNRNLSIPEVNTSAEDDFAASTQTSDRIFKIADGPVTTATLIQTLRPTTTLARYVLQENGHVVDLVLDSSGQIPRATSNTTIPGTERGVWVESGAGVVLQYLDSDVIKTVYLGFSSATSSTVKPIRVQFFPDNVLDYAASPDGKNVAFLLRSATGSDGYTAKADGTGSKKLFSVPLSQTLISWPAASTLLLSTKSSADSLGAIFSVQTSSGAITPLVYAQGITALGNKTLNRIVFRSSSQAAYIHDTKTSVDERLVFNLIPEKCVWASNSDSKLYCATPLKAQTSQYLDLWHQGSGSMADSLVFFNFSNGGNGIVGVPGIDGGVMSDIAELAVSPDEKYLVFIRKGDRSLWGVRLTE